MRDRFFKGLQTLERQLREVFACGESNATRDLLRTCTGLRFGELWQGPLSGQRRSAAQERCFQELTPVGLALNRPKMKSDSTAASVKPPALFLQESRLPSILTTLVKN